MKFNRIIKFMFAGALALGLSSCSGFLNRPNEDNYNTANFYLNDEQCLQGVNYLYNSPWYDFQRGFIKIGEVMSGNMYWGSSPYMNFSTNGTDQDLVNMSYSLWAVNGHCNTVIKNILNSAGDITPAVKNQAIGEALTLKALAYFFMVRSFGEVPIVHDNSELLGTGEYNDVKKVVRKDVYEYIIYTLETAMNLLPKKTSGWDNRIDYYACEGLLAKVYLTKAGLGGSIDNNAVQKAAEYAEDVIKNSGRSLTPVYSDIFRLAPATYNQTGEPMISWMWAAARDPWTQQNTLQSDLGMNGFSETGDLWGGWGGPSVDLMDAFGVDPLEDPRTRTDYDSRRQATMMMAGDTYSYFWTDKGGFDLLRFIYDEEYGKGGPNGVFQGPCGAQNVKHLYGDTYDHEQATGLTPGNMCYQLPTHILRLGDVYLIYAEAKFRLGDKDTALEFVNKVRARAYGSNFENFGKLTTLTLKDIFKERRLELAGEGDNWYDYVRRSYYEMDVVIAEIKSQRRNEMYSYGEPCKKYFETGFNMETKKWDLSAAEWTIDPATTLYNSETPAPNVTEQSFTLPFPTEDVVFNPNLASNAPAVEVDVRETYKYNF